MELLGDRESGPTEKPVLFSNFKERAFLRQHVRRLLSRAKKTILKLRLSSK